MDWIILTVIFAFISLGGISGLYMIARAFSLKGLEKWCKSEFMEILITGFIIIAVIGFMQGMLSVTEEVLDALTSTTSTSPVLSSDPANAAILEIYGIMEPVKKTYNHFFIINFIFAAAKEISIIGFNLSSILGKIPVAGYILGSFPDAFLGMFQWIMTVLGLFTMWMYFFVEVIKFGDYLAVILLPLGIVFRAFPMSRGAGAMFIAMSLGLAVVLPSAFLMVMYASGSSSQTLEPFEIENMDEYELMLENICIGNDFASTGMIIQMASSIDYPNLFKMYSEGNFFVMMMKIFIAPVIALIITYTFIRSFAMMLGADLAEIGKGLVKLI